MTGKAAETGGYSAAAGRVHTSPGIAFPPLLPRPLAVSCVLFLSIGLIPVPNPGARCSYLHYINDGSRPRRNLSAAQKRTWLRVCGLCLPVGEMGAIRALIQPARRPGPSRNQGTSSGLTATVYLRFSQASLPSLLRISRVLRIGGLGKGDTLAHAAHPAAYPTPAPRARRAKPTVSHGQVSGGAG